MGSGFSLTPVLGCLSRHGQIGHLALASEVRHAGEVPRKPRFEAPGAIQHVIARGNAGVQIVLDDDDRRTIIATLGSTAEREGWRIHAYCLMNNHIHLVVETPEPTLGSGMRRLLGGYAAGFKPTPRPVRASLRRAVLRFARRHGGIRDPGLRLRRPQPDPRRTGERCGGLAVEQLSSVCRSRHRAFVPGDQARARNAPPRFAARETAVSRACS